jgi:hypothetical protein
MSVRIVSPAEDSRVRNIVRKEIAQLVNAIRSHPRLLSESVQAMGGDDADGNVRTGIAIITMSMATSNSVVSGHLCGSSHS